MKYILTFILICYCALAIGQSNIEYFDNNAIQNNKIFLLGESHGIKSNSIIAKEMMNELKEKTNFKYFLAENDLAVGVLLNEAINKNDTVRLKEIILKFYDSPSRCIEKYDFYKYIIELNNEYEDDIQILGVDIAAAGIQFSKEVLEKTEDPFIKEYLKKNWEHTKIAFKAPDSDWDKIRDTYIIENFKELTKKYQLDEEVFFGVWGASHTYKSEARDVDWFAQGLVEDGKKVYSIVQYYINSMRMTPWHFSKKSPDGECFVFNKFTNFSGKDLRKYKKEVEKGEFKLVKKIDDLKIGNFIDGKKVKNKLSDYINAIIVVNESEANTVLGSNVCESR